MKALLLFILYEKLSFIPRFSSSFLGLMWISIHTLLIRAMHYVYSHDEDVGGFLDVWIVIHQSSRQAEGGLAFESDYELEIVKCTFTGILLIIK